MKLRNNKKTLTTMKTLAFKLIIIGFFSMIFCTAKADYVKKIHKSWIANKVQALNIESKFSNINFVNTRDDSVTIDVSIEIEKLSANNAEYLADQINFQFSLSNGTVYSKTTFTDKFKTKQEFSIVITVNIPIDRNLFVENKYGNVTLGDLKALGNFEIQYGNIQGQDMFAPNDEKIKLNLKYGSASFDKINSLYAEVGYGKLFVDEIKTANFDTKYTTVQVDKIEKAISDSQYDHYEFDEVNELSVDSKFTGWSIDQVNHSLIMDTQYGDVSVDRVAPDFEKIIIENSYGSINIGIPDKASYQLEGNCYYCKIRYNSEAAIIKQIEDNNHLYIKANVGKGQSAATVKIESRYGKVTLNE